MNITAADRDFPRKSTAISGGSIEQAAFSTRQISPADNSRRMQIDLIPTEKPVRRSKNFTSLRSVPGSQPEPARSVYIIRSEQYFTRVKGNITLNNSINKS